MYEISFEEAREVTILACTENVFKANSTLLQTQAIMGTITIVAALQQLGYRVIVPLKQVAKLNEVIVSPKEL